MNKSVKAQLRESFMNNQFIIISIATILSLIIYIVSDLEFLLYVFLLGLLLVILFIIGFSRSLKMRNHASKVRTGELKYKPYTIDKKRFIDECHSGLMYSLIRIDNEIYEIETQLDEINSTNYDNFICYINNIEIKGIDNFLNFKYDNVHSLNDLNKIEFLEYNKNDPEKYFVNNKIDI